MEMKITVNNMGHLWNIKKNLLKILTHMVNY